MQDEATLVSAQLSDLVPMATQQQREQFHFAIAYRVLVAAARGGQLRRLAGYQYGEHPFAVPTLLPFWLQVEDWGNSEFTYWTGEWGWREAASYLRTLLAHMTLCQHTNSSHYHRRITSRDLQTYHVAFPTDRLPTVKSRGMTYSPEDHRIKRYLLWFREDTQLARRVADAWNAIVERGEAGKVKCFCLRCSPEMRGALARWD